jgi:hypothetical protein
VESALPDSSVFAAFVGVTAALCCTASDLAGYTPGLLKAGKLGETTDGKVEEGEGFNENRFTFHTQVDIDKA